MFLMLECWSVGEERPLIVLHAAGEKITNLCTAMGSHRKFSSRYFAGHFLSLEQQALFRALVGNWLDRV